ncbi:hypothetical protein CQW23_21420 [Capsicum baccatum]|uniref:Uncharacterized protein n=1 Tax=Capsicum baccatum TaxID=33114 RepID=A0A2G2VXY5_CAPBA|nr:hypothetical protein CQW23_21420 [Capsicum baccatum]
MRGVRGRAPPQGCIVCSLTFHFCQRLFPRLELVNSWSHDNNFTSYSKAPLQRAAWCTKATAMRGIRGRVPPQGCIVLNLTLHFCQRLFPRLEPVNSWSHDTNFTSYSKAPLQRAAWCTKATAMRGIRGRAPPQGCIICSLTLHFCQMLFPRLEPVNS